MMRPVLIGNVQNMRKRWMGGGWNGTKVVDRSSKNTNIDRDGKEKFGRKGTEHRHKAVQCRYGAERWSVLDGLVTLFWKWDVIVKVG